MCIIPSSELFYRNFGSVSSSSEVMALVVDVIANYYRVRFECDLPLNECLYIDYFVVMAVFWPITWFFLIV